LELEGTIQRNCAKTAILYDLTHFSFGSLKVGKFLQPVSTFLGGFIIAFARGWLLSLVMLSSIPPAVMSAAAMSLVVSKLTTRSQLAYAEAGKVAEQTIGSIRTVIIYHSIKPCSSNYFCAQIILIFFYDSSGGYLSLVSGEQLTNIMIS
jgi:hypothetical protein